MPRLPNPTILQAYKISNLLPFVLRGTRELVSAITELRWLSEHVRKTSPAHHTSAQRRKRLLFLAKRRGRGEPLQYILGSQPFGDFDIKCRPGVLIPRPETESYTQYLVSLLRTNRLHKFINAKYSKESPARDLPDGPNRRRAGLRPHNNQPPIRVLDACSGSGCIAMSLHNVLSETMSRSVTLGVDISPKAVALANENLERNRHKLPKNRADHSIAFHEEDIFKQHPQRMYDIIISNPPYVSPSAFETEVSRSVRNYEPRSALVPPVPRIPIPGTRNAQDIFFHKLIQLHHSSFSKYLVMEVGDAAQAVRVLQYAFSIKDVAKYNHFMIWRDSPGEKMEESKTKNIFIEGVDIPILGAGKVRCVVLKRLGDYSPNNKRHIKTKHLKLSNEISTPIPTSTSNRTTGERSWRKRKDLDRIPPSNVRLDDWGKYELFPNQRLYEQGLKKEKLLFAERRAVMHRQRKALEMEAARRSPEDKPLEKMMDGWKRPSALKRRRKMKRA